MDLMLLRLFQRQVRDQCQVVLAAVPTINAAVQSGDHDMLWVGCQTLLMGAANASKAMWGSKGKHAEVRRPLRESLTVTDDSPLRGVNMRNNFEHFDERLDRWWVQRPNHNHVDRLIGPPSMMGGGAITPMDMFRVFDPTTNEIVFWGERFDVQSIATEVARIFPIASREAEKPHWVT